MCTSDVELARDVGHRARRRCGAISPGDCGRHSRGRGGAGIRESGHVAAKSGSLSRRNGRWRGEDIGNIGRARPTPRGVGAGGLCDRDSDGVVADARVRMATGDGELVGRGRRLHDHPTGGRGAVAPVDRGGEVAGRVSFSGDEGRDSAAESRGGLGADRSRGDGRRRLGHGGRAADSRRAAGLVEYLHGGREAAHGRIRIGARHIELARDRGVGGDRTDARRAVAPGDHGVELASRGIRIRVGESGDHAGERRGVACGNRIGCCGDSGVDDVDSLIDDGEGTAWSCDLDDDRVGAGQCERVASR